MWAATSSQSVEHTTAEPVPSNKWKEVILWQISFIHGKIRLLQELTLLCVFPPPFFLTDRERVRLSHSERAAWGRKQEEDVSSTGETHTDTGVSLVLLWFLRRWAPYARLWTWRWRSWRWRHVRSHQFTLRKVRQSFPTSLYVSLSSDINFESQNLSFSSLSSSLTFIFFFFNM